MPRFAQIERYKRTVGLSLRDDAFLHVQKQQLIKIQQSCLQHTHDLNIRHGFAMERHRDTLHRSSHQQPQQPHREGHARTGLDQQTHLMNDLPHLVLGLQDQQFLPGKLRVESSYLSKASNDRLKPYGELREVVKWRVKRLGYQAINEIGGNEIVRIAVLTVGEPRQHTGIDGSVPQRETFGDIHRLGLGIAFQSDSRQGIDHRLQHRLVTNDNSHFLPMGGVVLLQPPMDVLRLRLTGRTGNKIYWRFQI